MITEDYVSFETAKLLKEKGFEGVCEYAYSNKSNYFKVDRSNFDEVYCLRPTLQMATRWLREKYNIHIEPRYFPTPNIYRYVIIHSQATFENIDSHSQYFDTYEEACEAAIKYCLEKLI